MSYSKVAEQIKGIQRQLDAIQQAKAEKAMSGNSPFKYYNELKLKREAKIEIERRKNDSKKDLIDDRCQREISALEDDIEVLQEKVKKQIEDIKKKIVLVQQKKDDKVKELDEKFEVFLKENEEKAEEYGKSALECLNSFPKSKVEIELEMKLNDLKPKLEILKKEEREENYTTQIHHVERAQNVEIQAIKNRMNDLEFRRQNIIAEVIDCEITKREIPASVIQEAHAIVKRANECQEQMKAINTKYALERQAVKTKFPEQSKSIDDSLREIEEDAKIPLAERLRRNREFLERHPEAADMEYAWQREKAKLKAQSA